MRTYTLISLASHMPVEIGDVIECPGRQPGRLAGLEGKYGMVDIPVNDPAGRLETSLDALGLYWVDHALVRERPRVEPIDHRDHRLRDLAPDTPLKRCKPA